MSMRRTRSMAASMMSLLLAMLFSSVAGAQGAITSGETSTGTISPAGDSDTWTFAANTGDALVIRVGEITQTGSFTPRIRLFSPGAVLLDAAQGSVAAEIAITAASSGTFSVVVDDAVGTTATGTYRLSLVRTGSAVTVTAGDQGGPMTNGAMHTGTIDVGDLDVWTVAAVAGEAIVVRASEITGGSALTPWLRIYSPSGALLDSNASGAGAEVAVTAASNGTYLVVVADASSFYAGSGPYRLTLAKTGSAVVVSPGDEGGPMTNGVMHTGTLDLGDLDVWTVAAITGEAIVVRASEISGGSALTPWLRIYSPSGALLDSNASGAGAEVVVTAASNGTYLVVVADASSFYAGSGPYRLTLAKTGSAVVVSPGDEGGPMTNGVMHTGTIDLGDLDVWTVAASTGEAIVVRASEISGGSALTPWLRIYSPSGALLAQQRQRRGRRGGGDGRQQRDLSRGRGRRLLLLRGLGAVSADAGQDRQRRRGVARRRGRADDQRGHAHRHPRPRRSRRMDGRGQSPARPSSCARRRSRGGSALTPLLRIYSPSGALLDSNASGAGAEVAVTAASNGTYLVVVADASSFYAGSGPYRLTLAKTGSAVVVSPGDEGGPLPTGMSNATIDLGDLDVWTAYFNAGDGIAITMQEIVSGGPLSPWLRIYSPTGALVGNNSGGATAQVTITAASTGTYLVVAGDGSSFYGGSGAYRLTKTAGISANANLTNLVLSAGVLSPPFASGTLAYSANVVSDNNTITVTPTLADPTATVAVNGGPTVASGTPSLPITLSVGNNPISVVVTAQNGTTKTYTVNVNYLTPSMCVYSLSPPDLSNRPKTGGPVNVVVTVPAGCPVTATSFQPWVSVNSITPSGGTTTVSLQIGANAGPARATSIVMAGRLYLITQLAGP